MHAFSTHDWKTPLFWVNTLQVQYWELCRLVTSTITSVFIKCIQGKHNHYIAQINCFGLALWPQPLRVCDHNSKQNIPYHWNDKNSISQFEQHHTTFTLAESNKPNKKITTWTSIIRHLHNERTIETPRYRKNSYPHFIHAYVHLYTIKQRMQPKRIAESIYVNIIHQDSSILKYSIQTIKGTGKQLLWTSDY